MSYANDTICACGRPKVLVIYLLEDESKYLIECPVCANRELVDENA